MLVMVYSETTHSSITYSASLFIVFLIKFYLSGVDTEI